MTKFFGFIFFICVLVLISSTPIQRAGECEYGSVHAWVRTSGGDWENATAHPILKRGESFEIKITLQGRTNLRVVYLLLHEIGTPTYEVLTGPSIMEQLLEHWGPIQSGQSWTYLWNMRVKTNTTWVDGYSPLELYVQFTKDDEDDSSVTFDVLNAYIIDELWEKPLKETDYENISSEQMEPLRCPDISFIMIIIFIFLIGVYVRTRR